MDIVGVVLALVVIVQFTRTVLITMGVYKGPILHSFEKYGGDEALYLPLLNLVLWSGVVLVLIWLIFSLYAQSRVPLISIGVTFGFFGYLLYLRLQQWALAHPAHFLRYPHWYAELVGRTTREERRRLSYMWLRLPYNLKLAYNTNDRAFFQWVDLVLVATVPYGEPD